jgi:tetratricopeptide (TPR) repeat protein
MKLNVVVLVLVVATAAWASPPGRSPRQVGVGRSAQAKPNDAKAHLDRGIALYQKGDLDGAIAEYREAIRLKPVLADAHYNFGLALEAKGEKQAALEEYRKASELDTKNDGFRADYERLSKELKK